MKFESGMLGFLIIVLAVGGAIAGTVMLSAEEQTNEVTRYVLVADVTGLFDTDESPKYMDYDLARNYTGYYTMETVVNGVNYWGGAEFVTANVNNYPVRMIPQTETEANYRVFDYSASLTTSDPPGEDDFWLAYITHGSPGMDVEDMSDLRFNAHSYTLSSLITALGVNGYQYITIKPISSDYMDMIFFATPSLYQDNNMGVPDYYLPCSKEWANQYPEQSMDMVACFSCKINTATGNVDLYYGNEPTTQTYYKTIPLSQATIITGVWAYNNAISVHAWDPETVRYMDISKGVTVTGVGE